MSAAAALTADEMINDQPVPPEEQAQASGLTLPADMVQDAQEGLVRLAKMSPDELSSLIERRVEMLNTEISAREARRAAIAEASTAQKILDIRRERAKRIRSKVNMGSSVMAAMFAGFIVATIF